MEIFGVLLGLLSVVMAWYFGTNRKRGLNKLKKVEQRLEEFEKYTGKKGHRYILRDSLFTLSTITGYILLVLGFIMMYEFVFPDESISELFRGLLAGCVFGGGIVIIEHAFKIGKTFNPDQYKANLKKKLEKLKDDIDNY